MQGSVKMKNYRPLQRRHNGRAVKAGGVLLPFSCLIEITGCVKAFLNTLTWPPSLLSPYLMLCSHGRISCYQNTLWQIARRCIVWLNRLHSQIHASCLNAVFHTIEQHFSCISCNFHVNYLLLRGRKNRPDNVITDVLSWSYLKYLFLGGGGNAVWQVSIYFSISIKQTCLLFGLKRIDGRINSGLLGERGALITSSRYQVQTANVTQALCEIDWGGRSKQIPSADELSYSEMKRKSQKCGKKSVRAPVF